MIALVYVALLAVAVTRIARMEVARVRVLERMVAVERDFKRSAVRVGFVAKPGTMVELGAGRRMFGLVELRAFALELVAGGERLVIRAGTTLQVIAASVTLDPRGIARVAAETELLCHVPVRRQGDPDVRALPPGEVVFLFDDGARLFAPRGREVAWWRAGVLGAMAAVALPWPPLALIGIVMLLIDQILARGLMTWALCTRPVRGSVE